jgi:hypothetical protein
VPLGAVLFSLYQSHAGFFKKKKEKKETDLAIDLLTCSDVKKSNSNLQVKYQGGV